MKNISFFVLLLLLTSCEKIMHEQETQIAVINSAEEMDLALVGLYSALSEHMNNNWGQVIPQEFADDFSLLPLKKSERMQHAYAYGENLDKENNIWEQLYNIVAGSNNIICQLENRSTIPDDLKSGLGEAYLLRAYAYFRLVRIFGRVPLVKDININYSIGLSEYEEVYASIVADLNKALKFLPAVPQQARLVNLTPHRGTAKAILAEVYLTMGGFPLNNISNYLLAAKIAGEVIDSAEFFNYRLIPDLDDLWNGTQKQNSETILGLYYTKTGRYDNWGYDNELNNITAYIGMWPDSVSRLNWEDYVSPCILANIKFYNSYPASYRRDVTFQSILPTIDYITQRATAWPIGFINYVTAGSDIPIFYKKFGYYCSADTTTEVSYLGDSWIDTTIFNLYFHRIIDQPIYIYRFAHTLLTYAEAKARSGQPDESAYEAINKLRRRANKLDINAASEFDLTLGLSASQFADSVVRERELELCGEMEGRWFDLVRLKMVDQLVELRGGGPASAYFAQIPENEIILNPNLE